MKIYRGVVCTLHPVPPMVPPYITIIKFQNQVIGIGIMVVCHAILSHMDVCVTTTPIKTQKCSIMTHYLFIVSFHLFLHHPQTLSTTNLFPISIILSFQQCYMNEIIWCLTFWIGFFHLAQCPWDPSSCPFWCCRSTSCGTVSCLDMSCPSVMPSCSPLIPRFSKFLRQL